MNAVVRLLVRLASGALLGAAAAATTSAISAQAPVPACAEGFLADSNMATDAYRDCLREWGARGQLARVSTDALYDAHDALSMRATTHPSLADVESMRLLHAELNLRHALRPAEQRDYFSVLLDNGLWDDARRYIADPSAPASVRATTLPERTALHAAPAGHEARYWRSSDAGALVEQSAGLDHGVHLVITAWTGCHFCAQAARDIAQDEAMHRVFLQYALWIARPGDGIDPHDFLAWRDQHGGLPMDLVTDVRGWPMPDVWSTPRFYFIVDGKVVKEMQGWMPGRLAEVKAEFAHLGVAVD